MSSLSGSHSRIWSQPEIQETRHAPDRPAVCLDSWIAHAWKDGLQVETLWAGDRLVVRTRHSTYALTILAPRTRELAVCGGRFFSADTRVCLDGCSLGGSLLKIGGLYVGISMELRTEDQVIITSPVRSIGYVKSG